jgi:hypothetical protein
MLSRDRCRLPNPKSVFMTTDGARPDRTFLIMAGGDHVAVVQPDMLGDLALAPALRVPVE